MVGMRRREFVTQRGGGIPISVDRVEKGLEFLAGHRAVRATAYYLLARPDGAFSLGCLHRAGRDFPAITGPPAMQVHVRCNPPLNARAIAIRMQAPMKPAIK
jgi:hypothetical protein